jgi:hypothetical protein
MPRRAPAIFLLLAALCLGTTAIAVAAGPVAGGGGPDPAVKRWPGWTQPVACGYGAPFDALQVFSGPTDAERGTSPPEVALRRFLAKGLISWAPKKNWRLLTQSATQAEFGSGRLSRGFIEVFNFERVKGKWKWWGSGGCQPRVVRNGETAITWSLNPDQHLTASTRVIEVNLGPGECNDGRPQSTRLEKPEFREENGDLLMALWLHPVGPGPHNCAGLVEPPTKITLPEPLGDRNLYDGGVFPPWPADQPETEG